MLKIRLSYLIVAESMFLQKEDTTYCLHSSVRSSVRYAHYLPLYRTPTAGLHPLTHWLSVVFTGYGKNTARFMEILGENFKKYAEFFRKLRMFSPNSRRVLGEKTGRIFYKGIVIVTNFSKFML